MEKFEVHTTTPHMERSSNLGVGNKLHQVGYDEVSATCKTCRRRFTARDSDSHEPGTFKSTTSGIRLYCANADCGESESISSDELEGRDG
jgi:hypothetical protein